MEATLPVLDAKTAALKRRSIRRYRKDPVPEGLLREILEAALRAPSAWNLQPWRIVVVRDPATKRALREAAFGQAHVEEAPVVLVLYADLEDALAHLGARVTEQHLPPTRILELAGVLSTELPSDGGLRP